MREQINHEQQSVLQQEQRIAAQKIYNTQPSQFLILVASDMEVLSRRMEVFHGIYRRVREVIIYCDFFPYSDILVAFSRFRSFEGRSAEWQISRYGGMPLYCSVSGLYLHTLNR